jgi:hypothetical protein
MSDTAWVWADLNDQQLRMVTFAEQTLGADYLVAFQPARPGDASASGIPEGVDHAVLTESQLECLRGLEAQLQATIVAYKQK